MLTLKIVPAGMQVAVAVAPVVEVRVAVAVVTTVPVGQPPPAGRYSYRVGTFGVSKPPEGAVCPPRAEFFGPDAPALAPVTTMVVAPAGNPLISAWLAELPLNGSGTPATNG